MFGLIGVADLDKAYESRGYSHAHAVSAQRLANALASFMGALNMVYPLSGWSLEVIPHPAGIRYIARVDCCGKVVAVEASAKDACFSKSRMSSDELIEEVYKRFSSVIPDIPSYNVIRSRIDTESFSTYKVLL